MQAEKASNVQRICKNSVIPGHEQVDQLRLEMAAVLRGALIACYQPCPRCPTKMFTPRLCTETSRLGLHSRHVLLGGRDLQQRSGGGDDVGRPMLRGSPWTWWMKDWSSTQDEALQWQSSFLRITWLHWSLLDCMSNEPWCLPLFVWVCVSMFAWRCLDNWTNLGGRGRMTQILKTCKLQLHVSSPSVMKTAKLVK